MGAEAGKPLFGPDSSTALGESAARQGWRRSPPPSAPSGESGSGGAGGARRGIGVGVARAHVEHVGGGGSASGRRGWADADSDDDDFFSRAELRAQRGTVAPQAGRRARNEAAPTPEVSAWSRPIMVMKRRRRRASGRRACPTCTTRAAVAAWRSAVPRSRAGRLTTIGGSGRRPATWGCRRRVAAAAPAELLRIQAQQEGGNEARKMAQLTAMGFPLAPAADALLRTGGDVSAAVALLTSEGGSAEDRRAAAAAAAAGGSRDDAAAGGRAASEGARREADLVGDSRPRTASGAVAADGPLLRTPATRRRRAAADRRRLRGRAFLPPRGGGAGAHSASPPASPAAPPARRPTAARAEPAKSVGPAAGGRACSSASHRPRARRPAARTHAAGPPDNAAPTPRAPPRRRRRPPGGGGGGGGSTMADKLKSIRQELVIDAALPMAAIKQRTTRWGCRAGPLPAGRRPRRRAGHPRCEARLLR